MHVSEINYGERLKDVHFTEDTLAIDLVDGRPIIVTLEWYPRLLDATAEQTLELETRRCRVWNSLARH